MKNKKTRLLCFITAFKHDTLTCQPSDLLHILLKQITTAKKSLVNVMYAVFTGGVCCITKINLLIFR